MFADKCLQTDVTFDSRFNVHFVPQFNVASNISRSLASVFVRSMLDRTYTSFVPKTTPCNSGAPKEVA
eukprot:6451594-Karenia_brevis.AAC.1